MSVVDVTTIGPSHTADCAYVKAEHEHFLQMLGEGRAEWVHYEDDEGGYWSYPPFPAEMHELCHCPRGRWRKKVAVLIDPGSFQL